MKKSKAEANAGSVLRRDRIMTTRANAGVRHEKRGAPPTLKQFHIWIELDYSLHSWKVVSRRWGVSKPTIDECHKKYRADAAALLQTLKSSDNYNDLIGLPLIAGPQMIGLKEIQAGIELNIDIMAATFKGLAGEKPG